MSNHRHYISLALLSMVLLISACATHHAPKVWKALVPDPVGISLRFNSDSTLTLWRYDAAMAVTTEDSFPYIISKDDVLEIQEPTLHEEKWQLSYSAKRDTLTIVSLPDTVHFVLAPQPKPSTTEFLPIVSAHRTFPSTLSHTTDRTPLSRVTLYGVHDGGIASEKVTSVDARCQMRRIDEMLTDGIRLFDIRLNAEGYIAHGKETTEYDIKRLFGWCKDFLEGEGKQETIVLLIGRATGKDQWRDANGALTALSQNLLQVINEMPAGMVEDFRSQTLGEARGKIILLKRQDDCPVGSHIAFDDNPEHQEVMVAQTRFHIEDMYKPETARGKWQAIRHNLERARTCQNNDEGHLTFVSVATNSLSFPWRYAWQRRYAEWHEEGEQPQPLNPLFYQYLNRCQLEGNQNVGWVMLDFY